MRRCSLYVVFAALSSALILASVASAAPRAGAGPQAKQRVLVYTLQGDTSNSGTGQTLFGTTFNNGFCAWCFTTSSSDSQAVAVKAHTFSNDQGIGIIGQSGTNPGPPYPAPAGVLGSATAANGSGVIARHLSNAGAAPALDALTQSTDPNGSAVKGVNLSASSGGVGVWGNHAGFGWGLYGFSSFGTGVVGQSNSGYAGYFFGNVHVTGTLSKAAGSFRIDNPLNPAREYLQHSFVESPDMMNVYNGNIRIDANGFATVKLPRYFDALNKDFRYQLTAVGREGWDAKVGVWEEIEGNQFVIRSDTPGILVSWQVTGVRNDPYARANRIEPVVAKSAGEQGLYVYPQGYGQPVTKNVFAAQMRGQVAKRQSAFFQR